VDEHRDASSLPNVHGIVILGEKKTGGLQRERGDCYSVKSCELGGTRRSLRRIILFGVTDGNVVPLRITSNLINLLNNSVKPIYWYRFRDSLPSCFSNVQDSPDPDCVHVYMYVKVVKFPGSCASTGGLLDNQEIRRENCFRSSSRVRENFSAPSRNFSDYFR